MLANGSWVSLPHGNLGADNWRELIQSIKAKGMTPGVSLKPGTPVEDVFPLVTSCTQ
jgi:ribulose-phosphate 3-epimerase